VNVESTTWTVTPPPTLNVCAASATSIPPSIEAQLTARVPRSATPVPVTCRMPPPNVSPPLMSPRLALLEMLSVPALRAVPPV
jgi:hypothetical protein